MESKTSEPSSTIYSNMRDIISIGDDLRDCGIESAGKIDLPRIVVVGAQSSGKSSLLESIVGFDFLPRGDGVVTRRPLELRLVHISEAEENGFKPYAVFGDDKDVKIYDFFEVRRRIETKTDEIAGKRKGIIDKPIILTIYANSCPDLSVVDLPGITRIPLDGSDQTQDVEAVTKNMALRYIKNKRTLILCVIAANVDLSTSEVLKMAREEDPKGDRTLGILTKVDLMDQGTDCLKIIRNQEIKLKHGYIAVKNRSQKDINEKVTVAKALDVEKRWFETHSIYRSVPDKVGTEVLSRKLSKLLYEHIKDCLPEIERQIDATLDHYEKEARNLGEGLPKDQINRYDYILENVRRTKKLFGDILAGAESMGGAKDGFCGLTKINLFIKQLHKKQETLLMEEITKMDIGEMMIDIINSKGLSLPGFFSLNAFEKRVQDQISKLHPPVSKFIDTVQGQLSETVIFSLNQIFKAVPQLGDKVKKRALEYLKEITEETKDLVKKMYDFEKRMIFTTDPSFVMDLSKLQGPTSEKLVQIANQLKVKLADNKIKKFLEGTVADEKSISRAYLTKVKELKELKLDLNTLVSDNEIVVFIEKIVRYFEIATKNLNDTIPKIVGANLVLRYMDDLDNNLIKYFFQNPEVIQKLEEDPDLERRRVETTDWIEKLKNAQEIFHGRVRSFKAKVDVGDVDEADQMLQGTQA